MNRLFEISKELGEIATRKFEARRNAAQLEADILAREAAIIPEGGWPGSNADTRKAAEKAAKAADTTLTTYAAQKLDYQDSLDQLDLRREILTAERDAWQWSIRDLEAQAAGMQSAFVLMEHYIMQKEREAILKEFIAAQTDFDADPTEQEPA